jgi:hypothetical protein
MTRDRDDIDAALLRKGFKKENGDHFYYIYWNLDGKKTMKKTRVCTHCIDHEVSDSSYPGGLG